MTTHKEALTALVHEMEYVLSCINADKVPFDGDDFHEALRLGKEALSQTENDKERCVGCEACIDTACGRDECPKGWPKAAQPEQEPIGEVVTAGVIRWKDKYPSLGTKLYTTPPQRKPLTDEQILTVVRDHYNPYQRPEISFARAIEAAHGIKG